MDSRPTTTGDAPERGKPRLGRAVVEDEVEARAMLSRVNEALFETPAEQARLGRYILERRLGEGAFGVVYLARDPDLGRHVALKALRPSIGLSEASRHRFFREAQLLGSVLEPGLAAVFDMGTAPAPAELQSDEGVQVLFIVMEFVDGPNLATWLRSEPREWSVVRDVFVRAGRGLLAAHDRGIVHRDFKPANVLMASDGAVKVADFGLALAASATDTVTTGPQSESLELSKTSLTRTGAVVGTPAYMAPEQHAGERADPRADQFAFCASLYYGLCGQHAFGRGHHHALYERKLAGEFVAWPSNSQVPRWVRSVVERGLRPDPDQRYPSMRPLLSELERSPVQRFGSRARWLLVPAALALVGQGVVQALKPASVSINASSDAGTALENINVSLDGQPIALRDGVASVPPGQHRIEVSASRHGTATRAIDAKAGGNYDFAFDLAHHRGSVDITAAPSAARIAVDGLDHGSRVRALGITTGQHSVEVRLVNHYAQQFELNVDPGQHQNRHVALEGVETWDHAAPGLITDVRWVPDITGDFRDELALVRAGTLEVLDPWTDTIVMSQRIAHGYRPSTAFGHSDHDGAPAFFAYVRQGDGNRTLTRWKLGAETAVPEWTVNFAGAQDGESHLIVLEGDPAIVVVNRDSLLEGRNASGGELAWTAEQAHIKRLHNLGRAVLVEHRGGLKAIGADGMVAWELKGQSSPTVLDDLDADRANEFWATDESGSSTLRSGVDGRPRSSFAHWGTTSVRPLPDGTAWTSAPGITVVDADGSLRRKINGASARVLELTDRNLAVTTLEGSLRFVDLASGNLVAELPRADVGSLRAGDFNGDGLRELMLAGKNSQLRFLDQDLEPLATLDLSRSIKRLWAVHDGNHDGTQELVFQNNAGIFVVKGPSRKWTVSSDHGFRATPSVVRVEDRLELVTTIEEQGTRRLARVRAHDGQISTTTAKIAADFHRAAGIHVEGEEAFGYFTSAGAVTRYELRTGTQLGQHQIVGHAYATPTLVDVDNDGAIEVLVSRFGLEPGSLPKDPEDRKPVLMVLSEDLTTLEESVPLSNFTWAGALALDLTGDGAMEVMTFGLNGSVEVFEPRRGWRRHWHANLAGRINLSGAAIGPTKAPDVAVMAMAENGARDDLVILRGVDGSIIARHHNWGSRGSRPLALDVDGDADTELFALGRDGNLRRFDSNWEQPTWSRSVAVRTAPTPPLPSSPLGFGHLSRLGPWVLAMAWADGTLAVVDTTDGDVLWRSSVGAEVEGQPILLDVDNDGASELVVATHEGKLICLRVGAAKWEELSGFGSG